MKLFVPGGPNRHPDLYPVFLTKAKVQRTFSIYSFRCVNWRERVDGVFFTVSCIFEFVFSVAKALVAIEEIQVATCKHS